ncbi:ceratotoxin-D [Ceratitis capitata]|uniref:Ceratotoxin-D n=1 Tax=Ceratitis capitata TaxID=7213 RepID=CTXD_CERCA|nr:ceratotoxin-D [Ceratitis capitata]O17513.1 RecName: Full=Ceratotoxin-D; Flags: Precursor [Ceratitis capitata]CAA75598.1 ceratotoxin D [Ceratitis capitata]
MANLKAVFLICILAFIAFHCVVGAPTAEDSIVVKRSIGTAVKKAVPIAKKVGKVAIPIAKAVLSVVGQLVG